MKKVFSIWSWAILLALCVGFSSCSDDDDEVGGGTSTNVDIIIDGEKMPTDETSVIMTNAHYVTPMEYMNILIHFEQYYAPFPLLNIYFELEDLNSIKVGDDITKYNDFSIKLGAIISTAFNSGKIIVTKFDNKKQILSLEFSNVAVTNTNITTGAKKNHTISGKVTLPIEVD